MDNNTKWRHFSKNTTVNYNVIINKRQMVFWLKVIAIVSFLILLLIKVPNRYKALYMEPIIYLMGLILFIRPYVLTGMGSRILVLLYCIKLCILPITTVLGNFTTIVAVSIYTEYWLEGCLYIALEWLIIAFSIRLIGRKYYKLGLKEETEPVSDVLTFYNHQVFYIIMIAMTVLCIGLFLNRNNLSLELFWIWKNDNTAILVSEGGATYYLFKFFMELVKPMLFFWITVKIWKSNIKNGKNYLILFFAFIAAALMTEYRLLSVLTGITIFVYVLSQNSDKKFFINILKVTGIALFLAEIVNMTTHGQKISQTMSNLGRLLDIYCGGYIVAAASCSVHMKNGLVMFLHDLQNGSYLLIWLFDRAYSSTEVINNALNPGARGTFYELMVQCKDFFGIFSPVAIGLCVAFVLKMDYKASREQVELYRIFYLFCGIGTAFTMLMYTYSMVVDFIVYKCLIWLLFIWLDKRIMFGKRSRCNKEMFRYADKGAGYEN